MKLNNYLLVFHYYLYYIPIIIIIIIIIYYTTITCMWYVRWSVWDEMVKKLLYNPIYEKTRRRRRGYVVSSPRIDPWIDWSVIAIDWFPITNDYNNNKGEKEKRWATLFLHKLIGGNIQKVSECHTTDLRRLKGRNGRGSWWVVSSALRTSRVALSKFLITYTQIIYF